MRKSETNLCMNRGSSNVAAAGLRHSGAPWKCRFIVTMPMRSRKRLSMNRRGKLQIPNPKSQKSSNNQIPNAGLPLPGPLLQWRRGRRTTDFGFVGGMHEIVWEFLPPSDGEREKAVMERQGHRIARRYCGLSWDWRECRRLQITIRITIKITNKKRMGVD
jgi:hypothetical protein